MVVGVRLPIGREPPKYRIRRPACRGHV